MEIAILVALGLLALFLFLTNDDPSPVKRLAAGEALAVPALLMVRRGLELQGVGGEVVLR